MGGGSKNPPDSPDYAGAAKVDADAAKEANTQATWANRPTINTPWGQQSWQAGTAVDPATGKPVTTWEQQNTLNPESQAALDSQMRVTTGKSQAAETLLGQATGAFQTPFAWDKMPAAPESLADAQSDAYDKMSAMLEPGRERQRESQETRLANQGLARGTEAYKNAQRDQGDIFAQQDKSVLAAALGEGRSDVATQQQLRQAGIAEEAQRRGMSLNELNALLTGQQVSTPSMPGFSQAQQADSLKSLDAAKAQGDFALDRQRVKLEGMTDFGDMASGVGSLATAAAMFY